MVSDPRRLGHPISRCRRIRIQGNLTTDRRRYRVCKRRGNLELSQPAPPKERESRRLDDRSPGKPEMRDEGQPKSSIAGVAGGARPTGGTQDPRANQRRRKHEKLGATRVDIAGTAEEPKPRGNPKRRTPAQQKGSVSRGNPRTQPGRSRKMQEARRLATSSAGRTGRCMIQ